MATTLKEVHDDDHDSFASLDSSVSELEHQQSTTNEDSLGDSSSDRHDAAPAKHDDNTDTVLAKNESLLVNRSKLFMYLVLLTTAGVASVGTYFFSSQGEQDDFRREFENTGHELLKGAEYNAKQIFGNIVKLGVSITSSALEKGSTWPNVTLPNFDIRITEPFEETRNGADMVLFAPKVTKEDRFAFEKYAVENQGWISDDLKYKGLQYARPGRIPDKIHSVSGDNVALPFSAPLWEIGPVPSVADPVLADLYTHPSFRRMIDDVEIDRKLLLSEVVGDDEFTESLLQTSGQSDRERGPSSFAVQPVFNTFGTKSQLTIVAYVFAVVHWEAYFFGILSDGVDGVIAEIEDTCGESFCFQVDGNQVSYFEEGCPDHRQSHYDMQISSQFAEFARFSGSISAAEYLQYCSYKIKVIPSDSFEEKYTSKDPILFTLAVLAIFVFTSLVFALYDTLVSRRQTKVMATATRTTAIVQSLFPKNVQDRIMEQAEEQAREDVQNKRNFGFGQSNKLKAFLSDDGDPREKARSDLFGTKPIADLFPAVTIMFCDIVGFTAWSSTREPEQVFILLETLFAEFDEIAKRRGVFKVETVGDCYVAVCGLPEPNRNHAAVMGRFARDCLVKMRSLMERLERSLGPDTTDLSMRFGLHSGPVTAGVLRGERARFQLFGDTINTAARMESTGLRGKIQVSQATADLLNSAGKTHWLSARQDKVVAKGKGELVTYWLNPSAANRTQGSASSSHGDSSASGDVNNAEQEHLADVSSGNKQENRLSDKDLRLVDWNTDVLVGILTDIAAMRDARAVPPSPAKEIQALEHDSLSMSHLVIEEVSEVIALPRFDSQVTERAKKASRKEVDKAVVEELREYIRTIALTYRDNPFHSFEHAAHVTISVHKLFSRIVAPEQQKATCDAELHDNTYGITSDPLTRFAVVLSALIHDSDHSGVPNAQLVKENATIATAYANRSVAESNSLDICWGILMDEAFRNLRQAIYSTAEEYNRFRKLMVNTVLATDIVDKELKSQRNARWEKTFSEASLTDESSADARNRKATIVIEHLIQASDVAHTMQHWHVYRKWNARFFRECYKAYKQGRAETDPSEGWYKGELGFFDFYIIPLAKKLQECGVFGVSSAEYLDYALKNRQEWENRGESIVEEMLEEMNDEAI